MPLVLLGPISFNTFVNDLAHGAEYTLSQPAHHTHLRGVADPPEGPVAIQRDGNGMKESVNRNLKVQQEVQIPAPNLCWGLLHWKAA